LQNQHLQQTDESVLASCLALLFPKYPDLASIVKSWPDLPEQSKAGILAIAQYFTTGEIKL
jgi:hypothetical protein